jgi:hypothetical protein
MKKILLLGVFICFIYLPLIAQPDSQTRTANVVNDYMGGTVNNWSGITAQSIEFNDGQYGTSKKLSKGVNYLLLLLRNFNFSIPANANIDNIVVTVRRFKTGKGSVTDYFAALLRNANIFSLNQYGFRWANTIPYPESEGEFTYTQQGSGTNGGLGTTPYTWTPAMLNDPAFGMRIDIAQSITGSVVVQYDQVKITVNFTVLPAPTQVQPDRIRLQQPIVYPNPFTSTTLVQFTAAETGNANIEVFDIAGRKCETIFSQNVIEGQLYTATAGANTITTGIYFYRINNGSQSYTGKMVKLE